MSIFRRFLGRGGGPAPAPGAVVRSAEAAEADELRLAQEAALGREIQSAAEEASQQLAKLIREVRTDFRNAPALEGPANAGYDRRFRAGGELVKLLEGQAAAAPEALEAPATPRAVSGSAFRDAGEEDDKEADEMRALNAVGRLMRRRAETIFPRRCSEAPGNLAAQLLSSVRILRVIELEKAADRFHNAPDAATEAAWPRTETACEVIEALMGRLCDDPSGVGVDQLRQHFRPLAVLSCERYPIGAHHVQRAAAAVMVRMAESPFFTSSTVWFVHDNLIVQDMVSAIRVLTRLRTDNGAGGAGGSEEGGATAEERTLEMHQQAAQDVPASLVDQLVMDAASAEAAGCWVTALDALLHMCIASARFDKALLLDLAVAEGYELVYAVVRGSSLAHSPACLALLADLCCTVVAAPQKATQSGAVPGTEAMSHAQLAKNAQALWILQQLVLAALVRLKEKAGGDLGGQGILEEQLGIQIRLGFQRTDLFHAAAMLAVLANAPPGGVAARSGNGSGSGFPAIRADVDAYLSSLLDVMLRIYSANSVNYQMLESQYSFMSLFLIALPLCENEQLRLKTIQTLEFIGTGLIDCIPVLALNGACAALVSCCSVALTRAAERDPPVRVLDCIRKLLASLDKLIQFDTKYSVVLVDQCGVLEDLLEPVLREIADAGVAAGARAHGAAPEDVRETLCASVCRLLTVLLSTSPPTAARMRSAKVVTALHRIIEAACSPTAVGDAGIGAGAGAGAGTEPGGYVYPGASRSCAAALAVLRMAASVGLGGLREDIPFLNGILGRNLAAPNGGATEATILAARSQTTVLKGLAAMIRSNPAAPGLWRKCAGFEAVVHLVLVPLDRVFSGGGAEAAGTAWRAAHLALFVAAVDLLVTALATDPTRIAPGGFVGGEAGHGFASSVLQGPAPRGTSLSGVARGEFEHGLAVPICTMDTTNRRYLRSSIGYEQLTTCVANSEILRHPDTARPAVRCLVTLVTLSLERGKVPHSLRGDPYLSTPSTGGPFFTDPLVGTAMRGLVKDMPEDAGDFTSAPDLLVANPEAGLLVLDCLAHMEPALAVKTVLGLRELVSKAGPAGKRAAVAAGWVRHIYRRLWSLADPNPNSSGNRTRDDASHPDLAHAILGLLRLLCADGMAAQDWVAVLQCAAAHLIRGAMVANLPGLPRPDDNAADQWLRLNLRVAAPRAARPTDAQGDTDGADRDSRTLAEWARFEEPFLDARRSANAGAARAAPFLRLGGLDNALVAVAAQHRVQDRDLGERRAHALAPAAQLPAAARVEAYLEALAEAGARLVLVPAVGEALAPGGHGPAAGAGPLAAGREGGIDDPERLSVEAMVTGFREDPSGAASASSAAPGLGGGAAVAVPQPPPRPAVAAASADAKPLAFPSAAGYSISLWFRFDAGGEAPRRADFRPFEAARQAEAAAEKSRHDPPTAATALGSRRSSLKKVVGKLRWTKSERHQSSATSTNSAAAAALRLRSRSTDDILFEASEGSDDDDDNSEESEGFVTARATKKPGPKRHHRILSGAELPSLAPAAAPRERLLWLASLCGAGALEPVLQWYFDADRYQFIVKAGLGANAAIDKEADRLDHPGVVRFRPCAHASPGAWHHALLCHSRGRKVMGIGSMDTLQLFLDGLEVGVSQVPNVAFNADTMPTKLGLLVGAPAPDAIAAPDVIHTVAPVWHAGPVIVVNEPLGREAATAMSLRGPAYTGSFLGHRPRPVGAVPPTASLFHRLHQTLSDRGFATHPEHEADASTRVLALAGSVGGSARDLSSVASDPDLAASARILSGSDDAISVSSSPPASPPRLPFNASTDTATASPARRHRRRLGAAPQSVSEHLNERGLDALPPPPPNAGPGASADPSWRAVLDFRLGFDTVSLAFHANHAVGGVLPAQARSTGLEAWLGNAAAPPLAPPPLETAGEEAQGTGGILRTGASDPGEESLVDIRTAWAAAAEACGVPAAVVYGPGDSVVPSFGPANAIGGLGGLEALLPLIQGAEDEVSLLGAVSLISSLAREQVDGLRLRGGAGGYEVLAFMLQRKVAAAVEERRSKRPGDDTPDAGAEIFAASPLIVRALLPLAIGGCPVVNVHQLEGRDGAAKLLSGPVDLGGFAWIGQRWTFRERPVDDADPFHMDDWIVADPSCLQLLLLNHQIWGLGPASVRSFLPLLDVLRHLVGPMNRSADLNAMRLSHETDTTRWLLHLMTEGAVVMERVATPPGPDASAPEPMCLIVAAAELLFALMLRCSVFQSLPPELRRDRDRGLALASPFGVPFGPEAAARNQRDLNRCCEAILATLADFAQAGSRSSASRPAAAFPDAADAADDGIPAFPATTGLRYALLQMVLHLVLAQRNLLVAAEARANLDPVVGLPLPLTFRPVAGLGKQLEDAFGKQTGTSFWRDVGEVLSAEWFVAVLEAAPDAPTAALSLRLLAVLLQLPVHGHCLDFGYNFFEAGGIQLLEGALPRHAAEPAVLLHLLALYLRVPVQKLRLGVAGAGENAYPYSAWEVADAFRGAPGPSEDGAQLFVDIWRVLCKCFQQNLASMARGDKIEAQRARGANTLVLQLLRNAMDEAAALRRALRDPQVLAPLVSCLFAAQETMAATRASPRGLNTGEDEVDKLSMLQILDQEGNDAAAAAAPATPSPSVASRQALPPKFFYKAETLHVISDAGPDRSLFEGFAGEAGGDYALLVANVVASALFRGCQGMSLVLARSMDSFPASATTRGILGFHDLVTAATTLTIRSYLAAALARQPRQDEEDGDAARTSLLDFYKSTGNSMAEEGTSATAGQLEGVLSVPPGALRPAERVWTVLSGSLEALKGVLELTLRGYGTARGTLVALRCVLHLNKAVGSTAMSHVLTAASQLALQRGTAMVALGLGVALIRELRCGGALGGPLEPGMASPRTDGDRFQGAGYLRGRGQSSEGFYLEGEADGGGAGLLPHALCLLAQHIPNLLRMGASSAHVSEMGSAASRPPMLLRSRGFNPSPSTAASPATPRSRGEVETLSPVVSRSRHASGAGRTTIAGAADVPPPPSLAEEAFPSQPASLPDLDLAYRAAQILNPRMDEATGRLSLVPGPGSDRDIVAPLPLNAVTDAALIGALIIEIELGELLSTGRDTTRVAALVLLAGVCTARRRSLAGLLEPPGSSPGDRDAAHKLADGYEALVGTQSPVQSIGPVRLEFPEDGGVEVVLSPEDEARHRQFLSWQESAPPTVTSTVFGNLCRYVQRKFPPRSYGRQPLLRPPPPPALPGNADRSTAARMERARLLHTAGQHMRQRRRWWRRFGLETIAAGGAAWRPLIVHLKGSVGLWESIRVDVSGNPLPRQRRGGWEDGWEDGEVTEASAPGFPARWKLADRVGPERVRSLLERNFEFYDIFSVRRLQSGAPLAAAADDVVATPRVSEAALTSPLRADSSRSLEFASPATPPDLQPPLEDMGSFRLGEDDDGNELLQTARLVAGLSARKSSAKPRQFLLGDEDDNDVDSDADHPATPPPGMPASETSAADSGSASRSPHPALQGAFQPPGAQPAAGTMSVPVRNRSATSSMVLETDEQQAEMGLRPDPHAGDGGGIPQLDFADEDSASEDGSLKARTPSTDSHTRETLASEASEDTKTSLPTPSANGPLEAQVTGLTQRQMESLPVFAHPVEERLRPGVSAADLLLSKLETEDVRSLVLTHNVTVVAGLESRPALLCLSDVSLTVVFGFGKRPSPGSSRAGPLHGIFLTTQETESEDPSRAPPVHSLLRRSWHGGRSRFGLGLWGSMDDADEAEVESGGEDKVGGRWLGNEWDEDGAARFDVVRVPFEDLYAVYKRLYQLRPVGLEVFDIHGASVLMAFEIADARAGDAAAEDVLRRLLLQPAPKSIWAEHAVTISGVTGVRTYNNFVKQLRAKLQKAWLRGGLSNFAYLLHLNALAGRSFNDLTQYPVFPWVLADYESDTLDFSDSRTFRDLRKPMGALGDNRAVQFQERYESLAAQVGDRSDQALPPPFHYGTHYSCAGYVLYYLLRLEPYARAALTLQDGRFDKPDRLFKSVAQSWNSASRENLQDVRELVPEFFFLPEFLENGNAFDLGITQKGQAVHNVELPPWARGDPREFVRLHRKALESAEVSVNLHHWVDLVFGSKQRGEPARLAQNVFVHVTYEGAVDIDNITDPIVRDATIAQIQNFGVTPSRLFKSDHPPRQVPYIFYTYVQPAGQSDGAAGAVGIDHPATLWHASVYTPPLSIVGLPQHALLHPVGNTAVTDLTSGLPVGDVRLVTRSSGALSNSIEAVPRGARLLPGPGHRYFRYGLAGAPGSLFVLQVGSRSRDLDRVLSVQEGLGPGAVTALDVCHRGELLVTGDSLGRLRAWDITDAWPGGGMVGTKTASLTQSLTHSPAAGVQLRPRGAFGGGHDGAVTLVRVAGRHGFAVSAGVDRKVLQWAVHDGLFLRPLAGHAAPVASVDVNEISGDIVTLSGNTLRLWSCNGALLAAVDTLHPEWPARLGPLAVRAPASAARVAVSTHAPDWLDEGGVAVTGHAEGGVCIWALRHAAAPEEDQGEEGKRILLPKFHCATNTLHVRGISFLGVAGNGRELLVGDASGRVSRWAALRLEELPEAEVLRLRSLSAV